MTTGEPHEMTVLHKETYFMVLNEDDWGTELCWGRYIFTCRYFDKFFKVVISFKRDTLEVPDWILAISCLQETYI